MRGREVEFKSVTIGVVDVPWRRMMVAQNALPHVVRDQPTASSEAMSSASSISISTCRTVECRCMRKGFAGRTRQVLIPKSRSAGPPSTDIYFFLSSSTIEKSPRQSIPERTEPCSPPPAAQLMGITDAVLAQDPTGSTRGFGGGRLTSRLHQFNSLTIGNQRIGNPKIVVTDLRLRGIDLILGDGMLGSGASGFRTRAFECFFRHPSGFRPEPSAYQ